MQSFIGQINFVKGFVPDFSRIILPLQSMIKRNYVFKWGHNEHGAFNLINYFFINSPSLATPNFYNHFILYNYSSETSYASILTQVDDEKVEAPMSLFSSNFQGAKLNYSYVEKQAFAILKSTKHFRPFLLKTHNKVIVPFSSMRNLLMQRELAEKGANWVTTLQEYDIEIRQADDIQICDVTLNDTESKYVDIIFYLKNGYAPM